jgi:hypothetical protein
MRGFLLPLSAVLLTAATGGPQRAAAQGAVSFTCVAPAGHVCQFAVRTGGGQMNFPLPSGETKEVSGLVPHVDTYCVCDPGPVTPDCKQPRLDLWCLGSWSEVQPGVNTQNDIDDRGFAIRGSERAD